MASQNPLDLQRREINNFTGITWKFGDGTNYIMIDENGEMTFVGDATRWDDVRVPIESTKLQGTRDPDYELFRDNGAGSTGVWIYWFDNALTEEVFFTLQLPHGYKEGSTIYPHVHWTPKATADGNPAQQRVAWGLEYTWADIGALFGATEYIYGYEHTPTDDNVIQYRHYMTDLQIISGVGHTVSSMLCCRLFRAVSHSEDDYEDDAGLLEIDFHIELDTFGSKTEDTK